MSAGDAASELADAYDTKLNSIAPGAVWIQLGLMAAVGSGALLLFSILRPNNTVIYQPKIKYSVDGKQPPKISKGYFSWVKPVMLEKESTLMETVGLDAVCFLRFLRMSRNIFLAVASLSCVVLIPINVVYNLNHVAASDRSYITMLTIQNVKGAWLWAHVAVMYITTFIVFFFVWVNYRAMVRLRWQWFRSEEYQNALHSRSLLITQVAKGMKSDAGIAQLLTSLQIPYPTTAVHIGRKVGLLPELIKAHNDAVRSLEGVLTRYFKDPDRLPTNRPTLRIGGWMGMGGKKVDAIEYLTDKIKRFDERIEITRQQIGEKKPENYGFASFESVPYAHLVAKKLSGKRKKGSKFELAPAPTDIIWENITLLDSQRRSNKFLGAVLLVVFCFFYTIPLLAVSVLANIAALSGYVPFIASWQSNYKVSMQAFVGVVPPLLSVILQLFLPVVIRWIAKGQGATTHSQSDRIVTARYSAFLLITQFFIFSVIGVIVNIISRVVSEITGKKSADTIWATIKTIPDQFQSTWIIQSTYWLTVIPLRGASYLFDLAQVVSLLWTWGRTKLFGRTPREIREWTKPPEFDYAVYFSNHILMIAVALVYTPLAPLVPLFAAAAFWLSSVCYKYNLMYVFVSRVETGGRLWRVVINRVLFALVMMQALMLLTIGLQTGWYNSLAVAPPIVFVIIFKVVLKNRFDERFKWFIPSEKEMAETYLHQADARKNRLQKRFGHPSLHDALFTPMLHQDIAHLLPTIYHGRIAQGKGLVDGRTVEQNTAGGLKFDMLASRDLEYDRAAYLRQRDEDTMTVTTAAAFAGTKQETSADFEKRRKEYLTRSPPTPGPDDLPHELSRMPTHMTDSSTENLIQYPPHPPRYMSPTLRSPPSRHSPNLSQQSFDFDPYDPSETINPSFRPESRSTIASRPASPFGRGGAGGYRQPYYGHTPSLSQQSLDGYQSNAPPPDTSGQAYRSDYSRVDLDGRHDEA